MDLIALELAFLASDKKELRLALSLFILLVNGNVDCSDIESMDEFLNNWFEPMKLRPPGQLRSSYVDIRYYHDLKEKNNLSSLLLAI